MAEIISLAAVRRAQQVAPVQSLPLDKLLLVICRVAPSKVSLSATVLLQRIAIHLAEGENELSYTFLSEGLGATRKTVMKWVEELEDASFLKVRRSRVSRTINAVNQFEIDFNSELGVDMPELKTPRKSNKTGSVKITPPREGVVEKLHPYNVNNNIIDVNRSLLLIPKGIGRASPPRFDTVSEALEFTVKKVTRVRQKNAAPRPGALTMLATKAAWTEAMLQHYPTVPAIHLTIKDFAIFKNKVQPVIATSSLSEFFEFIVSSWTSLRTSKFEWLRKQGKDVAVAPSLTELLRYWKIFAQAFADSKMRNAQQDVVVENEIDVKQQASETARLRSELSAAKKRMEVLTRMAIASTGSDGASFSDRQKKANDIPLDDGADLPEWK